MTFGSVPRCLGVLTGALLIAGCSIERAGLASADSGLDAQVQDAGARDTGTTDSTVADREMPDAGRPPVLDSLGSEVVAHGASLSIRGSNLGDVDQVEIGGVPHVPTVIDAGQLLVPRVSDVASTGPGDVVALAAAGRSNSLSVTVLRLVISELDQQTDAGPERRQFIEIAAGVDGVVPEGYSLVLYGSDGLSYRSLALSAGTDSTGLLLIGSDEVTPTPSILLPVDAIRAGPGAAVIHQGLPTDFPDGATISSSNAIDGLVFHRSDTPESDVLLDALFDPGPERVQVNENLNGSELNDSIQRCSRERLNGASFIVAGATPGSSNDCDPPSS